MTEAKNHPSEKDHELAKYDRAVSMVVNAARRKFIQNRNRGKFGWDDPKVWQRMGQHPLNRAKFELDEARKENIDIAARTTELGDVLNFLAFDRACEEAVRCG